MPTYRQAHFIRRALESLLAQTLDRWELVIVSDDPRDGTAQEVAPYVGDPRVRLLRLPENGGLGAALNAGIAATVGDLVAYLPADDVSFARHLESLFERLDGDPRAALAFAGVRHHHGRESHGRIEGYPLQLVQVMHRRTDDRWVERDELTTDDLDRMFWSKLRARGSFAASGEITCEWVDHPLQRHKLIQERPRGGLNPYRGHYEARHPLVFEPSVGNRIDERALYAPFHDRRRAHAADGLTVLLVGELAYNPERVLALEERGHRLFGLWTSEPWSFNTVGPLPFGGVEDLPRREWRRALRRLKPDVIYALLNWQAIPFAHEVMSDRARVPFVWHFKEGPFFSIERGTWPELRDLYGRSDGRIDSSPEARDWFVGVDPALADGPSLVLDGDLPKAERFFGAPSPRLSQSDGQIHTVVPGRPVGIDLALVGELARHGIHLHLYGGFQGPGLEWLREARRIAGELIHEHGLVAPDRWVSEFSQYDAGWLHLFRSENDGDPRRATWDDLNLPARIPTLLAGGLPLIQRDNEGAVVASQSVGRQLDVGLFFTDADDLVRQLRDETTLERVRANVSRVRERFAFDYHADRLIEFFGTVIANTRRN